MPAAVLEGLLRKEPSIGVLSVGDEDAPPKGTLDPEILALAAQSGRILVTRDKRTMPGHMATFFKSGKHTAGVIILKPNYALGSVIEDLFLIWLVTTPEEWIDRTEVIPYASVS